MLRYCCKELCKYTVHVARSRQAKKTIEEGIMSATSCHQYYHILTFACLVQWYCYTSSDIQ